MPQRKGTAPNLGSDSRRAGIYFFGTGLGFCHFGKIYRVHFSLIFANSAEIWLWSGTVLGGSYAGDSGSTSGESRDYCFPGWGLGLRLDSQSASFYGNLRRSWGPPITLSCPPPPGRGLVLMLPNNQFIKYIIQYIKNEEDNKTGRKRWLTASDGAEDDRLVVMDWDPACCRWWGRAAGPPDWEATRGFPQLKNPRFAPPAGWKRLLDHRAQGGSSWLLGSGGVQSLLSGTSADVSRQKRGSAKLLWVTVGIPVL